MSLTGAQLLTGFSEFLGDYFRSTTTGGGNAGGTTLVDTALGYVEDDEFIDWWLRPTGATNQYEVRRVRDFVSSTGTLTVRPAFTAQTDTSQAYELHRHDPRKKFIALDAARLRTFPDLHQSVYADSLTGDGIATSFDIPSAMRRGPLQVMVETPLSPDVQWNFISDPKGDSTDNWTASSVTASTVDRSDADLIVPKYDETCTKLVVAASTAATYTQVVASMANDASASDAADRQMTFGTWVYCTEASKIRLGVTDDTDTTYSSYHGGAGWELLTVEKTIAGDNSTTLSALFDIASTANAATFYWNRAWFYFGTAERIRDTFAGSERYTVRRDDTTQRFYMDFAPLRGYQLRLIGSDVLSALGTTAASQVTNTMELDEEVADILYAEAAKLLFGREAFVLADINEAVTKGTMAEAMRRESVPRWALSKQPRRVMGPWAS